MSHEYRTGSAKECAWVIGDLDTLSLSNTPKLPSRNAEDFHKSESNRTVEGNPTIFSFTVDVRAHTIPARSALRINRSFDRGITISPSDGDRCKIKFNGLPSR